MKNLVIIIICLLLSVWAISTFFDSSEETQVSLRLEQAGETGRSSSLPVRPVDRKTTPAPGGADRPGRAVRLELTGEQALRGQQSESAAAGRHKDKSEAARAIRVVPHQTQRNVDYGPIPEPAMQVGAEFVVQEGHAGYIEDIAFGPSGKYLATSEYNKRVKLWDLRTGQLIRTFHHHLSYEHGPIVEFSRDGKILYTGGGMPFNLKAWDLPGNKLVRHTKHRSVVDFQNGPTGQLLAGYGWNKLTIMEAQYLGRKRIMQSKHQWGSFSAAAIDTDGRYCFSGHSNGTIGKWDIAAGSQMNEFAGHKGNVRRLFVDKGGKYLISVGWEDGQVKIWNKETFALIRTIQAHPPHTPPHGSHLYGAALDPSQRYIITGGSEGLVKLWSLKDGSLVRAFQKPGLSRHEEIRALGIDPTGAYVAAGGLEGRLWIWDFKSGRMIRTISGRQPHTTHKLEAAAHSEKLRQLNNAGIADVPLIVDVDPGLDFVAVRNDRHEYGIWDLPGVRLLRHFPSEENITACKLGLSGKRAYTGHNDERLIEWDLGTGVRLRELNPANPAMQVSRIDISPDAKIMVSQHRLSQRFKYEKDNTLNIWDLTSGSRANSLQGLHHVRIDPQWRFLLALKGKKEKAILRYDLATHQVATLANYNDYFYSFSLIRDGQIAVICDTNNNLFFWDTMTGKRLPRPEVGDETRKRVLIDHAGRYVLYAPSIEASINSRYDAVSSMAVSGRDVTPWRPDIGAPKDILISSRMKARRRTRAYKSTAAIWDIDKGKIACQIKAERELVTVKLVPSKDIAVSAHSGTITVWDLKNGESIREIKLSKNFCINRLSVDQSGKHFVVSTCRGTYAGDLESGAILATYPKMRNLRLLLVMHDTPLSNHAVALCVDDQDVGTFVDLVTGSKIEVGKFGPANRLRPEYIANGRVLAYSRHNSNVLDVWNLKNPERLSLLSGGKEWLAYTSKGYFDSSRYGGKLIAMVDGLDVFGVDQFAIRNNRPDLIMQTMGLGTENQKQHYYSRFRKRLRKSGFTPEQLSGDLHVPEVTIEDTHQKGKLLEVTFRLRDDRYRLKQYGIYVNDVPVFGSSWKTVRGRKAKFTDTVELTNGKNKVEITCLNEKGAESYRALTFADYNQPARGDLYFIGFGVSKYKDSRLDLKYAHKDALDLEAVFKRMTAGFNTVYHRAFVDEEVTVETIKQIKRLLNNAKVDDTLVLFIAGHGVHDIDPDTTYYFLTHGADLRNLSGTSASFEIFEELLTDAKPRKKLFLMDTCESGEIDEGVENTYYATAGSRGFTARTTRAIRVFGRESKNKVNRKYLYDLDRYVYNELARRSGAIVFSSSRGGEFSYESDTVANGFFTEAILQALSSGGGPQVSDTISTDQLRALVVRTVAVMSENLQHPAVDRDNIHQALTFQVVDINN